ncbi:ribonuclease H-like domain-containing protein [Tanacetum coccineum]|uniref:Ribonuclease H-like domain-containing protein n=1 Tax=Tanacetum coccineum TaxID=301880 RepID=A0ABQ4YRS5_9ASTR
MDVKSVFLYGKIEEEVYVCQPLGFEHPHFPDKVYKVEKALYGLHQAPRAWYETLSTYLLDNGFHRAKINMWLRFWKKFDFASVKTASTPMETNKALVKDEEAEDVDVHLYRSMIRSLMYLTASRPDIMFDVCACARTTTGRFSQFLGKRLISWQCKKHTIVANSTTEAKYVAAANYCGHVLWIQNQMLDYGFNFINTKIYIDNESTICVVKNPVSHSKIKHIEIRISILKYLVGDEAVHKELGDRMERAATTASSLEAKQDNGSGPRCQDTILGLRCSTQGVCRTTSKQFNDPPLSKVNTFRSREDSMQLMELMAHCTILCEFVRIKEKRDVVRQKQKKRCVLKNRKSVLIGVNTARHQLNTASIKINASTTEDGVRAITATIDRRDKIITEASIRIHLKHQDSEGLTSLPNAEIFEQLTRMGTPTTPPSIQTTHEVEETATMPYDSPLPGGDTPRSDEGRLKHNELMELITKLSDRVVSMEEDLKQTNKAYSTAFTKLVLKVRKLEQQVRSGKARKRARIVLSEDGDAAEDPSKQGRKITQIDINPTIYLVEDEGASCGEKGEKEVSTTNLPVSTAGVEVSTGTHDDSNAAAALVYIRRSASMAKDKGKAIMQEPKPPKKLKKRVQVQMSVDKELERKVQDGEQAKAMAEQEQERINFEAALELQRQYHALQNRPYSVAEVRKNMVMYLKNQAGYKQSFFKGMKYEEIRPIFEKVWDQTHTFVPMDSEDKEKGTEKKSGGTRKKTLAKKRASEKQGDQSVKRQKTEYDTEKEELKDYLDIVPGEEFAMDFESLATKFPIVDWKTYVLAENFMYYQIFRADGSSKNYKIFSEMLDDFDRQDVLDLHRLVKASMEGLNNEYNFESWRLFDSRGIHILLMNNGISIHMMTEKKYPLNLEMLSKILSKRLEVDHESTMEFELLNFIKSQVQK